MHWPQIASLKKLLEMQLPLTVSYFRFAHFRARAGFSEKQKNLAVMVD